MACSVKGELKCKDGKTSKFTVEAENNLKSIIEGVKKINSEISVVLTELVEQERGEGHAHGEDEEGEEEEDEEEEDNYDEDENATETTAVQLKSEPPAKRLKTITPS